MADYEDLSVIVGKMKRAAIDCWMADQDFYPVKGNEGTYCKWGWAPYQYWRPAEDGTGGGGSVGYGEGVTCEAQFDEIRAVIDGIVNKWFGLPDGSLCAGPEAQYNGAAMALGGTSISPTVDASGEVSAANAKISDVVTLNMSGHFRRPFIAKYATQFGTVQTGLSNASIILRANYAGEAAMWPAARTDVANICDSARKAWNTQAEVASEANTAFQLSVISAVLGAVVTVLTAGEAPVVIGWTAGLSAAAFAVDTALKLEEKDAAVSGSSYLEILDSLRSTLDDLRSSLYDQEAALVSLMTESESIIRGDLGDYDLDAFTLKDYPAEDATIKLDIDDVGIVTDHMQIVQDGLASAITSFGSAPASSPTPRGSLVGYSTTGTHWAAVGLHALVARCLSLTSAEYDRGRGLFEATAADFFGTDSDASKSLAELLDEEAATAELNV